MRKQRSLKELQDECDKFNAANAVGCEVIVSLDSGKQLATKTTSKAQVLSGHTPVIWIDGVRGCYDLKCVTPVEQTAAS